MQHYFHIGVGRHCLSHLSCAGQGKDPRGNFQFAWTCLKFLWVSLSVLLNLMLFNLMLGTVQAQAKGHPHAGTWCGRGGLSET